MNHFDEDASAWDHQESSTRSSLDGWVHVAEQADCNGPSRHSSLGNTHEHPPIVGRNQGNEPTQDPSTTDNSGASSQRARSSQLPEITDPSLKRWLDVFYDPLARYRDERLLAATKLENQRHLYFQHLNVIGSDLSASGTALGQDSHQGHSDSRFKKFSQDKDRLQRQYDTVKHLESKVNNLEYLIAKSEAHFVCHLKLITSQLSRNLPLEDLLQQLVPLHPLTESNASISGTSGDFDDVSFTSEIYRAERGHDQSEINGSQGDSSFDPSCTSIVPIEPLDADESWVSTVRKLSE